MSERDAAGGGGRGARRTGTVTAAETRPGWESAGDARADSGNGRVREEAPRTVAVTVRALAGVAGRAWALAVLAGRAAWAHVRAGRPTGTSPLGGGWPSSRQLMRHVREEWRDLDALLAHVLSKPAPPLPLFGRALLVPPNGVSVEGGSEPVSTDLGGTVHHDGIDRRWEFFAVLNDNYPEEAAHVISDAERVRRGEYRLLNVSLSFPGEVNWHLDPAQRTGSAQRTQSAQPPEPGKGWPRHYVGWMERWFWTEKRTSDVLPTWELNRHQHFVTLGRAYFLTGDERYPETCADQIRSWMAQNPPAIGVNWYSSLEIGMRLISWSVAFFLLRSSETFAGEAGKWLLKGLFTQAQYLWQHLTLDQAVPNNHLIGEVAAMVVVGGLFPEFKESETWVRNGLQILEEALRQQTHQDGVNKEQASGYHRFVLDLVLLVVLLGHCGTVPRSGRLERVLERMLAYALYAMDPAGQLPQLGDSGDGWGLRLDMRAAHRDVRPWLAVGAVLFRRPDFKFGATVGPGPEPGLVPESFRAEALWLVGGAGRDIFLGLVDRLPPFRSFAFREGGHYVLRDSWEPGTDYALIRSGEFGLGGEGASAHAHCDLLSVALWIGGRPVLVDSGTYSYHGPWRDYFRLTHAHNTLRLDGRDQAVPRTPFAWTQVPRAACAYHSERAVRAILEIGDVVIERHLRHPSPGLWRISDGVAASTRVDVSTRVDASTELGGHMLDWHFHFAPDLDLYQDEASGNWIVSENGHSDEPGSGRRPIAIITVPAGLEVHAERGWTSPTYGHKERNMQLVATWAGDIPAGGLRFTWEFKRWLR